MVKFGAYLDGRMDGWIVLNMVGKLSSKLDELHMHKDDQKITQNYIITSLKGSYVNLGK